MTLPDSVKVAPFPVHFADIDDPGQFEFVGKSPDLLSPNLTPAVASRTHHPSAAWRHALVSERKIVVSRSVNDVDDMFFHSQ